MARRRDPFLARVDEALAALPAEFRRHLDRVRIEVQDWPEAELLDSLGMGPDEALYGVFLGTPLPERGADPGLLPDRILIFRGPLEEDFEEDALADEIAITVMHEIGHAFGIDEARLEELGLD